MTTSTNKMGKEHDDKTCSNKTMRRSWTSIITKRTQAEGPPWKIIIFSANLIIGLVISQVAGAVMDQEAKQVWKKVIGAITMCCLSFIMINVGYEFTINKSEVRSYAKDMTMAVGAAGLPWIFVAVYYMYCLPQDLTWPMALLAARFAAPTSAGVLFSMLEAAGLKKTWLFQKARILAIFDDLDTIILMIPLKAILVGFKWELLVEFVWIIVLLALAWWKLHAWRLPNQWYWTQLYAVLITVFIEVLYYVTKHHIPMDAIHLEVLLPAFVLGCLIHVEEEEAAGSETDVVGCEGDAGGSSIAKVSKVSMEEYIKTAISAFFMLFVGLSMPSLFGGKEGKGMGAGQFVGHIVAVSLLMAAGKMFLCFFYRDEADCRSRTALGLGMCPRGEVGAGVIVISISLGIKGLAVSVSVACLVLNLLLSSAFIMGVKYLARSSASTTQAKEVQGPSSVNEKVGETPSINMVTPPVVLGRGELNA